MSAPSGGLFIFGWPQDADSSTAFVHGRRQARERELGKANMRAAIIMSALPPKADMCGAIGDVR